MNDIAAIKFSNNLFKQANNEQKQKIKQLENEIKNLIQLNSMNEKKIHSIEINNNNKNKNIKLLMDKLQEIKKYIIKFEGDNKFLFDKYNELANTINHYNQNYFS